MNRVVYGASAVFVTLSVASGAMAQSVTFESLDKNGDGKISLNEATVHDELFVAFKNLDKNRDGELTKEEFASYKK